MVRTEILEKEMEEVKQENRRLESKINDLEQYTRKFDIIINGIEMFGDSEDIREIILRLAEALDGEIR